MNYRNLPALLTAALLISGCDQLQTALNGNTEVEQKTSSSTAEPAPASTDNAVMTVNGVPISQGELNIYARSRTAQAGGEKLNDPQAILDEMVTLELMRQEAEKNGIASRPFIVAAIAQQKRSTLASAAVNDYMKTNEISDEEARELYDDKVGNAGDEYNARHILLETREQAVDVISALDKGSDFSELAMEKSTGPTGPNGGKLGWFVSEQMVKSFSDAATGLEKGSYSKEPVETKFGWHVIILDDSREITPPPFEDTKNQLKMMVVNQQLQAHIREITNSADIKIFE